MSPLHHNELENFVARGLKAQAAIDKIIAEHNSLATSGASTAETGTGAGESIPSRPRSSPDMLTQINTSTDAAWLKAVLGSQDYQVNIRSAAQRRLGKLFKKPASRRRPTNER